MPDTKRSGSRLIRSAASTAIMQHYCSNEMPECSCHIIFAGDMYTKEIWVHWWHDANGKPFSRLEVKKFHWSPACHPDPKIFESDFEPSTIFHQLPLAA